MGRTERFTQAQVIEAINASYGLQIIAAKKLKTTRETIDNYRKRYPKVQACIDENLEFVLDVAESKLFHLVNAGDLGAICFLLKTRGKSRGYVERSETDITSAGQALKQNLIYNIVNPETKILLEKLEHGREPIGNAGVESNVNLPPEPASLSSGKKADMQ
jgi:hypothetical protein